MRCTVPTKYVEAVFFNSDTKALTPFNVKLPTSVQPGSKGAMLTCNDIAWDNDYPMWAHKDPLTEKWWVFRVCGRSSRVFLKDLPTREAAEMWMVHHDAS